MTCKSVKRTHVCTFGGFVIMRSESLEAHGSVYRSEQCFTPPCQTFGGNFVAFWKVADLWAPVGVMNDGLVLLVARSECFSFCSVARKRSVLPKTPHYSESVLCRIHHHLRFSQVHSRVFEPLCVWFHLIGALNATRPHEVKNQVKCIGIVHIVAHCLYRKSCLLSLCLIVAFRRLDFGYNII